MNFNELDYTVHASYNMAELRMAAKELENAISNFRVKMNKADGIAPANAKEILQQCERMAIETWGSTGQNQTKDYIITHGFADQNIRVKTS